MQGFDDRWRDFPDYIIGITRDIWERRQVSSLHRYYADDIIFRMAAGIGHGNHDVIAATLATMAEFPDRELLAEDVIWSGTPADGMLSSHRLFCQATHTGPGLLVRLLANACSFARLPTAMPRTASSTMNG